jgi:hypothetical protein
MDIIGKLAAFIATMISDPANPETLQSFIELLLFLLLLILAMFARTIVLFIPPIRNLINYGERYTGQYVQIINSGTEQCLKAWYIWLNFKNVGRARHKQLNSGDAKSRAPDLSVLCITKLILG